MHSLFENFAMGEHPPVFNRFEAAVYLAALPYRRSVFQEGGWGRWVEVCDGTSGASGFELPFADGFFSFLQNHFTAIDRETAFSAVGYYRDRYQSDCVNFHCVFYWEDSYPAILREIYDPPPVLFYQGRAPGGNFSAMAIVGTRNPAPIAKAATEIFLESEQIRAAMPAVISGLARGIDGVAHRAAIRMGLVGAAVLGSGLLHAGPRENLDIMQLAAAHGVPFTLISEFLPWAGGSKRNFPRRNRIIAGLAHQVCVFQAPHRSGALITVRYALEDGRDIAIFDHPLMSGSGFNEGGRKFLQEGATPIELPELERRITRRPRDGLVPGKGQLDFWEKTRRKEIRWLGGDSYLLIS